MNALDDAGFEHVDVLLKGFEDLQLLPNAAPGFLWEPVDEGEKIWPPLGGEDVAIGVQGQGVLGQRGVNAVLHARAVLGEGHPSSGQLALVPDVGRRDPDGGQLAQVEQGGQAVSVELVGLVDVAHHDLGLGGVSQERNAASLFDLIDDPPVPAARCRQYQLPTVSRATGVPSGNWERKALISPGA